MNHLLINSKNNQSLYYINNFKQKKHTININISMHNFKIRFSYHSPFKSLRIYKNNTYLQLTNALFVNRMANSKWIVANSIGLYKLSCNLITSRLTDYIIQNTFGKIFTAGQSLEDVEKMSLQFRKQNIPVIIDYCGQGFVDQQSVEAELDKNALLFKLTADNVSKIPNQMISVKVSGLIDMKILRKLNSGVVNIHSFWAKYSTQGILNGQKILLGFQNIYAGTTEQDVNEFLSLIFNYESGLSQFKCDEVDFKNKVHPYYIHNSKKSTNKLINLFSALSNDEITLADNLTRRIDSIIVPHAQSPTNLKIVIDAEQSYIQAAIFSISQQYQLIYNRNRVFLVPTLQKELFNFWSRPKIMYILYSILQFILNFFFYKFPNYLKSSVSRIAHEIAIAQRNDLYFSMKYVRGAYFVEETRLAKQFNYENPIVDNFDLTTVNFLQNLKLSITSKFPKHSEVIVASHNQQTINSVKILQNQYPSNMKIIYAQLLGLADHLTIQLSRKGETVYKYLPYGNTKTMVPYLVRRAQQLSQMKYPLDLQYQLIKDEFAIRFGFRS